MVITRNPAGSDVTPLAYTTTEAAEALRVSRAHVYSLIERGELRSIKLGKSRRITAEALAELIAQSAA